MKKRDVTAPGRYELYTPYKMSKMTESEIRKAYSKLRSIGNKRISRMAEKGIGLKAREGFRYPSIAEIEASSKHTVASMLADVSKWLRDPRSSMAGERAWLTNFQSMMTDKGYADLVESVDKTYNTVKFLDDLYEQYKDDLIPSGDALDVLQETERLKIPVEKVIDNIDLFVKHLDDLEDVQPTKGGRKFDSRRLNALIKKWERKQ